MEQGGGCEVRAASCEEIVGLGLGGVAVGVCGCTQETDVSVSLLIVISVCFGIGTCTATAARRFPHHRMTRDAKRRWTGSLARAADAALGAVGARLALAFAAAARGLLLAALDFGLLTRVAGFPDPVV